MKSLCELKSEVVAIGNWHSDNDMGSPRYLGDCIRIKKIVATIGLDWTVMEAEVVWDSISNERDAGWLGLPRDDDDVLEWIIEHCGE